MEGIDIIIRSLKQKIFYFISFLPPPPLLLNYNKTILSSTAQKRQTETFPSLLRRTSAENVCLLFFVRMFVLPTPSLDAVIDSSCSMRDCYLNSARQPFDCSQHRCPGNQMGGGVIGCQGQRVWERASYARRRSIRHLVASDTLLLFSDAKEKKYSFLSLSFSPSLSYQISHFIKSITFEYFYL